MIFGDLSDAAFNRTIIFLVMAVGILWLAVGGDDAGCLERVMRLLAAGVLSMFALQYLAGW